MAEVTEEKRTALEESCYCPYPLNNDQGVCMYCGRWINYSEREQP